MDTSFDIVIPLGPNDIDIIGLMIIYTKKNIIGYRNIYIVTCDMSIEPIDDVIIIDENDFPFNKKSISDIIDNNTRAGWYLQQLIKLYAGFIIRDILDNYLVIDSDTFFMNPTVFFENNLPLYNFGTEYHIPYFDHMSNLHPMLCKQNIYSGITNHMMFQKNIICELFKLVEEYHNQLFWIVFLLCMNYDDINGAGASEYEIYFNYLHIFHKDKFIMRELKWQYSSELIFNDEISYISAHWYMRDK